ncbi:hypothetical protein NW752_003210 [Fusarium irregulare]|uniref:Uncharacterized protein n=1 Tax=Fusarium irregulare TaxID=2494466 RepID=A0A9W8Q0N3_9HYPO|nr:hypothetical protein NW766_000887 [Fusarium irregulare]KAJ4025734.1 hypothetical protein NW752_003210 [Fusarium irregulare]
MPSGADPSLVTGNRHHLLIQNKVHDATLCSAIQDPSILRNVGREAFYGQYKNIFARPGESVPQCAILVHQVNDPTASKVIGIAGSAFSITLGLVSAFVL